MTEGSHIINMKPKIDLLWSCPLDPFLERPQSKEHYRHKFLRAQRELALQTPSL